MRTIFSLIFFTVLGTATAQTKLYDPKELKEAADYYFSTLFSKHPDPYYFSSEKEFNKLKSSIYQELNKSLSKADFILTIARINAYLDMHSRIPFEDVFLEKSIKFITDKKKEAIFPFLKDSIDTVSFQEFSLDSLNALLKERNIDKDSITNSIFVLPVVEARENGLFFWGDSIHKIIAINGILIKPILSKARKYINRKLNSETNSASINLFINSMLWGKYTINPPFKIKFEKNNREETIEGTTMREWVNEFQSLFVPNITSYYHPYTYEVYPENSIAIFHIQTFDGKLREDYLKQLEKFKKEVNEQGIKYIFYDLTMNGGGEHQGYEALDIVKHDTVYIRCRETIRVNRSTVNNETVNHILLFPNQDENNIPDDRILFVLQSSLTASGADYFCRIVSENKLGVLVGEPTGELTKTFSFAHKYIMPHTGIHFMVANVLVDFSDYFKSLTTPPDIKWDVRNIKEFSEQELLNIINDYKNKKYV